MSKRFKLVFISIISALIIVITPTVNIQINSFAESDASVSQNSDEENSDSKENNFNAGEIVLFVLLFFAASVGTGIYTYKLRTKIKTTKNDENKSIESFDDDSLK